MPNELSLIDWMIFSHMSSQNVQSNVALKKNNEDIGTTMKDHKLIQQKWFFLCLKLLYMVSICIKFSFEILNLS